MKDTVLTQARKKRELYILLFAFIAAIILNLIGILKYGTPVKELVTEFPMTLAVTLFLYAVVTGLRLIWWLLSGIYRIFNKS